MSNAVKTIHRLPPPHTHTCPAKSPQTPMMHRMLKTAEPTMVPTPTSPWVMKTPANGGKEEGPIRTSANINHTGTSVSLCTCVFPTDDGGKELWCGAACCHEGGPGHVLAQVQFLEETKMHQNKRRQENAALWGTQVEPARNGLFASL